MPRFDEIGLNHSKQYLALVAAEYAQYSDTITPFPIPTTGIEAVK